MSARRVEVTFSEEEWTVLNDGRGFESRASFVKRHYLQALESALSGGSVRPGRTVSPETAPSRAPKVEGVDRASAFLAASQRKKS